MEKCMNQRKSTGNGQMMVSPYQHIIINHTGWKDWVGLQLRYSVPLVLVFSCLLISVSGQQTGGICMNWATSYNILYSDFDLYGCAEAEDYWTPSKLGLMVYFPNRSESNVEIYVNAPMRFIMRVGDALVPSHSPTPSPSISESSSASVSSTPSTTPSATPTISASMTTSFSVSATPSISASTTVSATPTPTISSTSTASMSPSVSSTPLPCPESKYGFTNDSNRLDCYAFDGHSSIPTEYWIQCDATTPPNQRCGRIVPPSGTNPFWLKYQEVETYVDATGDHYRFTSQGCFAGYTDVMECIANNQLESSCYTLGGGGAGARYCPTASTAMDPIICTKNGVFSVACTENYLNGLTVNGDETFCSEYPCDNTKLCYCAYKDMYEQPQAFVNGTWIDMQYIQVPVKVRSSSTIGAVTRHHIRSLASSDDVSMKLKDQKLTLTLKQHGMHMIFLDKDNFNTLLNTTDSVVVIEIPDNYFWTSGNIHVRVYKDYVLLEEKYLEVIGRTNCPEYDCIFCKVYFETFSCWHTRHQALFILFVLLFVMACFGLLCFTVPCVWWGTLLGLSMFKCMIMSPFNSPLMQDLGHSMKRMGKYAFGNKNNMMATDAYTEPYEEEQMASSYSGLQGRTPRSKVYPMIPGMLVAMMFFCCVVAYDGCTSSQVITAQTSNCVPTGVGTETCSVTYTAEITLTEVGDAVCVTLVKPDSTGKNASQVLASTKIKYAAREDRGFYQNQYWTSAWEGHYDYRVRCNTQGDCNESKCLLQNNSTDRTAYGNIDDPYSTQYPGQTQCQLACNGLGEAPKCNCILLFPACLFSSYGIVPKGESTNVLSMVSRRISPVIEIQNSEGGESLEVVLTTDGGVTNLGSVTAKYIGEYNDQVDPISLNYLVQKGGVYFMSKGSEASFPEAMLLGDIQADNPADLLVASTDAFIFAKDIVTFDSDDVEATYYFKPSAYSNLASASWAQSLPGTVDNQYWIFDNGTIYSRIYSGPSITLSFQTNEPLILSVNTSSVCPDGDLVSVGGCYNCKTGCTMRINVESDCDDGVVLLSADDKSIQLAQNSLQITKKKTDYTINFFTPNSKNNFKLNLVGSKKLTIPINFIAIEANTTATVNQGFASVNVTDDHVSQKTAWWNPFGWIEDVILGIANGWEWFLVILMAIAALILAGFCMFACVMYVMPALEICKVPLDMMRSQAKRLKEKMKKKQMKKDKKESAPEKKPLNKNMTRAEAGQMKQKSMLSDEIFGFR